MGEESYSLWIMPHGAVKDRLASEITHLAGLHKDLEAPTFLPHITLLGDIRQPQAQVLETAQRLASELKKYRINFQDAAFGTFYYQCVFLAVAQDPDVMAAAALARQLYGMQTEPYMPHLSLLYADLTDAQKDEVAKHVRGRLFGPGSNYDTLLADPGFTATTVAVWSTPTGDRTTTSWKLVAELPLA